MGLGCLRLYGYFLCDLVYQQGYVNVPGSPRGVWDHRGDVPRVCKGLEWVHWVPLVP